MFRYEVRTNNNVQLHEVTAFLVKCMHVTLRFRELQALVGHMVLQLA